VNVGIDNIAVDDGLSAKDIVNLGRQFKSLTPDTLAQFQLPVVNANRNGASVVVVPEDEQGTVDEIMNVFRGIDPNAPGLVAPSAVKVQVLNGSGRAGEASAATEALQTAGFQLGTPGNARETARTTIYFGTGQLAKAQLLERWLEAGADIVEDPNVQGVDVRLITGSDYTGTLPYPRDETAPAPPTSAPPAPTTATTAPLAPDC
jgi:hypothetical protein